MIPHQDLPINLKATLMNPDFYWSAGSCLQNFQIVVESQKYINKEPSFGHNYSMARMFKVVLQDYWHQPTNNFQIVLLLIVYQLVIVIVITIVIVISNCLLIVLYAPFYISKI